ncbi:amidohydrolase [Erythrobacter insulae]|uniref:Amidohydrolase n=1 Tax=Erythrobacter insulae TaxID=2584124 RepID=A0A547PB61_9SPHN|nr:amidohydrolase [Erythrobacter insulae]TRD11264.1 amidohydrolase [Erythrobacter insulae]
MKRLLTLAASAIALSASPLAAQDVVITNATVVTGDGSEPIENGVVVVENGRVTYAGSTGGRSFASDTVVDAKGAWVTPGIFATVTTLGLVDVGAVSESNDSRAGGAPFSASLDVAPAVNPNSQNILIHRAAGITRAATTTLPAASIFAGQGAIIDLDADGTPIVKARAFQMVDLGEGGARRAGGSRAATYTLFRASLREARALSGTGTPQTTEITVDGEVLLNRFDAEALKPVIAGTQKLFVAVERAADIRSALALKSEFPRLDMVLVGVSEGWMVANEIAAAGVPVLADPLDALPTGFDQLASTQSNVGRMKSAGVKVGLNAAGMENPRRLAQQAGNLVGLAKMPGASGLTWAEAFASISSIPAEISGMGGIAGVLKQGALGDVVIWDGDPLEVTTVPTKVYIGGVEQPLGSHQSRLKDRYRDLDESDLPKAYDW